MITIRTNKITVVRKNAHQGSFCETDRKPLPSQKILTQIGSFDVYSEYPLSNSSKNYLFRQLISRNCTRQIVHSSSGQTKHPSSSQFRE
mgnify:CR=1 FL=1